MDGGVRYLSLEKVLEVGKAGKSRGETRHRVGINCEDPRS